jgi:Domain of unknown function (DUF4340)
VKLNGLTVAVAVLAVLGGLVWWSNKRQAAAGSTTDKTTKLLTIPEDQFQDIRIKKVTGEVIDLDKQEGKWRLTQPQPLPADQDAVSSIVTNLSALNADSVVDEKATDFKPYGLGDPTLDITVKLKNGKTSEVLIGDDTPTGSGAYARVAGSPKVVTIASFVKSTLDKRPDDLRDKRLLTFDQDKLTRVELQAKGQAIEFGKDAQNEWQIVKPRPLRADSSAVSALVDKLRDAKMDLTAPGDPAKQWGAAVKVATATLTDAGGNQSIEIRKDKDKNYYAKSTAVAGIFKTSADVGDALDKSLADFRDKKIFDFGFSDPGKVELKNAAYTKSGDKWMSGSKTMDNATVQSLIDKLRDLTATKFVDQGAGEPVFEATVTSNSGKRVEKVTIRKQGTQYFAQREGEPSIYELDGKSVDDLQKAAGDVKEAAAPPAKKK